MSKKKKSKHRLEFSKIMLATIVILYVVTVIFSYYIVKNNPEQLLSLHTFVGGPTTAAIGFYIWKAKNENILKYNKSEIQKLKTLDENQSTIEGGNDSAVG